MCNPPAAACERVFNLRIADGLAELGWPVADRRADVEKVLPDSFQIEARGADVRIKKKPGAKE